MHAIIYILLIIATDVTSYYLEMYEVIYATPIVIAAWVAQITSLPHVNRMAERLEHPALFYKVSVWIDIFCVVLVGFCIAGLIMYTAPIYNYKVSSLLLVAFGVKMIGSQPLLLRVARDYGKICEEIRQHDRSRLPGQ
jgi:hypothetical protein